MARDIEQILKDFKQARTYVEDNYQDTWEDCWKVYNGHRVDKNYEGIADVVVPETFTIVESIVANIAGGKPRFDYLPQNPDQEQETEVLNQLVDFYWDQAEMTTKTINWVRDMVVMGNGILYSYWDNDKPNAKNIPLADFIIDPAATSPNDARFMGFRYLTSKSDLKDAKTRNPETGELEDKYKNIGKIKKLGSEWDELDKEEKEMFLGSTLGKESIEDQVEVIFILYKDRLYEIANRSVIIRDIETPFQRKERKVKRNVPTVTPEGDIVTVQEEVTLPAIKPFFPFAPLRNYVDVSLFFAKGDVEVIKSQQEQVNDLSNQKLDNITYVLNNMWAIDPQFADMASEIESLPGAVYPIPVNALRPIEKPVVTRDADIEMLRIKEEMRRATAADEVIQGVSQEQGRVTATEVQATLNQATQRFSTKISMLEEEGYKTLGSIWMKLIQIFVTQETAVRIVGPAGVEWKDYDPLDFVGEYEPRVRLESTSNSIKAEEGQKFQNMYQLLLEDPGINQEKLRSILLKKVFDLKDQEVQELLNVPPEQMMMGQDMMGAEMASPTPTQALPVPQGAL